MQNQIMRYIILHVKAFCDECNNEIKEERHLLLYRPTKYRDQPTTCTYAIDTSF